MLVTLCMRNLWTMSYPFIWIIHKATLKNGELLWYLQCVPLRSATTVFQVVLFYDKTDFIRFIWINKFENDDVNEI